MFHSWVFLLLLVPGGQMFMIHNTQYGLCLEESADTGQVLLKKCDLDSQAQQWLWINQGMLMCVGSCRCLSAQQNHPVQTQACPESDQEAPELMWDCSSNRLSSRNTSLLLSTDGQRVILDNHLKHFEWKSLDVGDICQTSLRLRRASEDQDPLADPEEAAAGMKGMTEEEREKYRWFYRTEDPTIWTFVLLVLAFVCLLIGFLLLGMGAMANKSRKKIAKYKAQVSLVKKHEGEELQVISTLRDNGTSPLPQGHTSSMSEGDTKELKAGEIVVTWKDGNTSCLYPDHVLEERQEELEKEQQEKREEVWQEREADDEGRMTE
ncbi:solute carrier family 51 subunit beta [Poeciliopsis prolifica]|uniref:solute carrier family 51 subunit beta n=1 Tax=Poeciliopsis prolifica TaxID=188132 RepID=UPI0024146102|nr:solute carrier family 51 subunit beta [Poeciliopsis prolifica]